jgi:hypothetical protein
MSLKANILGLSCLYTTISLVVPAQFINFSLSFSIAVTSDIFHNTIFEVSVAVTIILQPSLASHTKDHDTLYSLPLFPIQRIMTHSTTFPCFPCKGSWHTLQPSLASHAKDHDTLYSLPLLPIQRIMTHSTAFPCFPYKGSRHTLQPSLATHTKDHDTLYSLPLLPIRIITTYSAIIFCPGKKLL